MSTPAPASRAIGALASRELRLALRRGENLLVTLVIPAAVLVFFSTVAVLPLAGPAVEALLPGALALSVIATSFVSLGIATAYERHYGVLKRLGGAPLPRGALAVAKMLAVLAIEIVQVGLLVAIAWFVLGWRPGPAGASPALGAVALVLGTATFAGLGLAMAGRLRAEATLAVANGVFLALLLVGGIVVPLDRLPAPLAAIASVLPSAPLVDLFAHAVGSGPEDGLAGSVALLAAWAVASVALAIAAFRSDSG
jgi:ABC-2 type transport system permease protein